MRFLFKFHQNIFVLSAGSDYLLFASFSILGIILVFFIVYEHDKILRQKNPLKYYPPPSHKLNGHFLGDCKRTWSIFASYHIAIPGHKIKQRYICKYLKIFRYVLLKISW